MCKKINLFLLTIFFVLFSLSTLVLAVDCPIPDTGQSKCYDATKEITCPSPGEDFYGQDAQYTCNPQSYTDLGNGIVRDNVTGLEWQQDTAHGTYTWQQAIDICDNLVLGAHSDWRLPTIMELSFITNLGNFDPSINTDYFPNTMSSGYWSSTTNAYNPDYAWVVDFFDGGVGYNYKSSDGYVRAVRSGQCESFGNFVDNGNGTVTNTFTGLMWQQDTQNDYTWDQAISYCENLILANHTDWRLPDVNELQSLVDYSKCNPSIDPVFPNIMSGCYWSSTTSAGYPDYAWFVDFGDGIVLSFSKSINFYVRAVRSGSFDTSTTTTGPVPPPTTTITPSTTTTIFSLCPVEEIYGENSAETELLRYFRDNVLSRTPEGQEIIKLYYELSSVIVEMMEEDEAFKAQVKEMADGVLTLLGGVE